MATTPKPKPKPSATVTAGEAADLLGLTVYELLLSRARGLEPGRSGYKTKDNKLVWLRSAVTPKATK